MGRIKRNVGVEEPDSQLDEVDDERSMSIHLNEKDKEIIFRCHYRRDYGDELNADIDHILDMGEASRLVGILIVMIDKIRDSMLPEKILLLPEEGNPMRDNKGGT